MENEVSANIAWLGAADLKNEGSWHWLDKDGQQVVFYAGQASDGHVVGGSYVNWSPGEPNANGSEDCLAMYEYISYLIFLVVGIDHNPSFNITSH